MEGDELASRRLKVISRHLIRASISHETPAARLQNVSVNTHGNPTSFKYTLNNDLLSREQRQFYEENGFLVVKGLVKQDELDKYARRLDKL